MLLHDLLEGLGTAGDREHRGDLAVEVHSVVHDSRAVEPGALFCCIRGATTDGHDHARAAVAAGAVALLVEHFVEADVPQVRVASVRSAIGPVAARFHGEPSRSMRVVGVTGTNGKTTTTYLLEAIGRAAGERVGVIGTVETRVDGAPIPAVRTTPEAPELQALLARMRDGGVTFVAMEVSSHALEQDRTRGCTFAAACFTNLTHDHLDYHGTIDDYFAAKSRLFTPGYTPIAVVNLDDARGEELAARARAGGLAVTTFGFARTDADVVARDVRYGTAGTELTLTGPEPSEESATEVRTGLVGPFNVENALAAAATALALRLPRDAIVAGLAAPTVVPGRLEPVVAGQRFPVLVDYAHTPDALARVLAATRALTRPGGRVVLVFGCGGDRDRDKRPRMGEVAATRADVSYLTSDNPRSEDPEAIAADVLAGVPDGADVVVELDRRHAIELALGTAREGDVVVIAGKGHEPGQTARGVTVPFDDRAVAREALEALACA